MSSNQKLKKKHICILRMISRSFPIQSKAVQPLCFQCSSNTSIKLYASAPTAELCPSQDLNANPLLQYTALYQLSFPAGARLHEYFKVFSITLGVLGIFPRRREFGGSTLQSHVKISMVGLKTCCRVAAGHSVALSVPLSGDAALLFSERKRTEMGGLGDARCATGAAQIGPAESNRRTDGPQVE